MNLLTLKNNKVEVSPEALMIPEFKSLWSLDSTSTKANALKQLAYVYFLCDYNSVYQSFPKDKRSDKIRQDLGHGNGKIRLRRGCRKAIEKYEELQNTPSMKFLESARDALEAMTEYFNNIDFNERDSKGNPVYKATEVTRCLKDAGGMIESIQKLKEKVKTEIYEKVMARGKTEINPFEV